MDREINAKEVLKNRFKGLLGVFIAIVVITALLFVFKSILTTRVNGDRIRTAEVEIGDVVGTVTGFGNVVPKQEQQITSPNFTTLDSVYHQIGDKIDAGDSILKLNSEDIEMEIEQLKNEYSLTENSREKLRLRNDMNLIDYNAQLDIVNLRIQSLEKNLENKEKIYLNGGGAKAIYEKAVLDLQIQKLEKKQLEKRIENQIAFQGSELAELDLKLKIQEGQIEEKERVLKSTQCISKSEGVLTWINDNLGSTVQKGDIVAKISDLNSFKVETRISDVHLDKLFIGNPVIVKFDEYKLSGRILSIDPTIQSGTVKFYVDLDEQNSDILRSNQKVDVYVITKSKTNILRIKNGPFINGKGLQDVFLIDGDVATKTQVRIGETNLDWIEIEEGLQAGDEIIISDIVTFRNRDKIKITNR